MSDRRLTISAGVDQAIRRHGEETYPHECCGALVGRGDGVTDAVALPNTTEEGPRRRFLVRHRPSAACPLVLGLKYQPIRRRCSVAGRVPALTAQQSPSGRAGARHPLSLKAKYVRAVVGPVGASKLPSGSTLVNCAESLAVEAQRLTNRSGNGAASLSARVRSNW